MKWVCFGTYLRVACCYGVIATTSIYGCGGNASYDGKVSPTYRGEMIREASNPKAVCSFARSHVRSVSDHVVKLYGKSAGRSNIAQASREIAIVMQDSAGYIDALKPHQKSDEQVVRRMRLRAGELTQLADEIASGQNSSVGSLAVFISLVVNPLRYC